MVLREAELEQSFMSEVLVDDAIVDVLAGLDRRDDLIDVFLFQIKIHLFNMKIFTYFE